MTQAEIMTILKASLESITTKNGFNTDIIKVVRGVRTVRDFEGDLPSIALWKYHNSKERYESGNENDLNLRVWGYVECDSIHSDFSNLDALLVDCEKALVSSDYNSLYSETFVGDTFFYEGGVEDNFGIFEMLVRVQYEYNF